MNEPSEISSLIADVREQVLYLQELGVEALDADLASLEAANEKWKTESSVPERPATVAPSKINRKSDPTSQKERPAAGSRLTELPSLPQRKPNAFFDKYNPETGQTQEAPDGLQKNETRSESVGVTLVEAAPLLPEPAETIEQIRADIGPACTRCKLSTLGRSQVVNSIGNFNADLMFVGEAPGADEDRLGEPFVGRAGQLLTDIIEKGLKMRRSDCFIGNINRCRPPGNRAPEPDESVVCKPFLLREIAVVRPKVIVVLGATAAQNLLDTRTPISKLRGHFHDYLGVKVMPTFHPAYLLRDPHKKREVWEDMKMVRDYINR